MNDLELTLKVLNEILGQVLELSSLPNGASRQSVVFHYRHLIDFWQGYGGARDHISELVENDEVRRLSRHIRYLLSEIGAESVFQQKKEVCSFVQEPRSK